MCAYIYSIHCGPVQDYELRVGGFKYENLYDWNYPVESDDPRETSKRYRIYEGEMLDIICKVRHT